MIKKKKFSYVLTEYIWIFFFCQLFKKSISSNVSVQIVLIITFMVNYKALVVKEKTPSKAIHVHIDYMYSIQIPHYLSSSISYVTICTMSESAEYT